MESTRSRAGAVAATETQPAGGQGQPTLRSRVSGGLRWKLLSQVVGQGSRALVAVLLARLLTPSEFGLAAMALVFSGLTTIFTDLSLGAALVQRTHITERDRSTVFWTSAAAGVAITGVGIGVAPLVGDFFSRPAVVPLFAATACTAAVYGLSATQMALLTRALDFRSLELRQMVSTVVGGIAAVLLALQGLGAWAIVGQNLVVASVSVLLLWRLSSWRPRFVYSRESLRTFGSFGVKTLFARLLSFANLNGDNLLIGRFLGSTPLGVYSIAYNAMFLPASNIAGPIQQVMFPAFARLQHDRRALARSWIRASQLVALLNVAAFTGLAVVAPDFVPVVFGQKWDAVVPVLQLLSVAGIAQTLQTLNWSVLQAVGNSGRLLAFMVVSSVITVGAFVAGLRWGVVGVAGLFACARWIVTVMYAWTTCRTIGLQVVDYFRGFWPIARLALPMAAVVYAVRLGLVAAGVGAAPRLALLVALGVTVYGALVGWQARDLAAEFGRVLLPGAAAARVRVVRRRARRARVVVARDAASRLRSAFARR